MKRRRTTRPPEGHDDNLRLHLDTVGDLRRALKNFPAKTKLVGFLHYVGFGPFDTPCSESGLRFVSVGRYNRKVRIVLDSEPVDAYFEDDDEQADE